MRALVIQHDADAPAGHVSAWLAERGARQDVYVVSADGRAADPSDYDMVISLGSEVAAYDDAVPWVGREADLLRDAVDAGIPVLGICFGSQLLARALGGAAVRAPAGEIGWVSVRTREPSLVDPGPWMQWHHDTFKVPPGAELLADSPAGPQAYRLGRSLGVQFHPEVTTSIVEDWVSTGADDLSRHGVNADRLLAETRALAGANRSRAWRLMDAFVDRVARIR